MVLEFIKNKKWGRLAVVLAASLLLVWGLSWAFLPGILKHQLEKWSSQQLGRQVTVGAIHVSPWSLELALADLTVAGGPGAPLLLRINRIELDLELQSLLRWAPVVDALQLDGLQLRLTHQGEGHYDVDDILARLLTPSDPPSALPRFALYNVSLRSGQIDFVDQPVGRTHEVRELNLSIPFLSSLGARRELVTEPQLAFQLNGSHFDSKAQTTPFADSRRTDVSLKLTDFDLQPYLVYWPARLPIKPKAGVVQADVRLHFEQTPQPTVRLSGLLALQSMQWLDAQGGDVMAWRALRLQMADVRPLEQVAHLAELTLDAPQLVLHRDKTGAIDPWQAVRRNSATPSGDAPARDTAAAKPPAAWQVTLDQLKLNEGLLRWQDEAVSPTARWEVRDVALQAQGLAWPMRQAATFQGGLSVGDAGARKLSRRGAPAALARLSFHGEGDLQSGRASAELQGLPVALATPYAAQWLALPLGGSVDAQAGVQWQAAQWHVQLARLVATQLSLGATSPAEPRRPLQVGKLMLQDVTIDPAQRQMAVAKLVIQQPAVAVTRDREGRWMFERWGGTSGATVPASGHTVAASPEVAWRVRVEDVSVAGGQVHYEDHRPSRPVVLEASALSFQMQQFASDARQPAAVKLTTQLRARRGEPGQLTFVGSLASQPWALRGRVQAVDLPAHALSPYVGEVLNLRLLRADAGFKGELQYAQTPRGPMLKLGGDAVLEDLLANTVASATQTQELPVAEELLSWKALSLRGLSVALVPGQATRVAVAETALSDFYARLILHEDGRLNLENLVKSSALPSVASPAGAPASAAPAPVIEMGPMSLLNGRVLFSDRFIQPSYSANLSALNGRLSAFSSVPLQGTPVMADLVLRGRAEGTATIEITGKLNPLSQPMALDISGKMRDLELPPLSPYSVKYAGHGIERGKLAMDVRYQVQPDGQLVANNKLVLNQLTFGDPVEGAPHSLPVRLAVALLADRDGVIDINLPISGSLNDPEFRLGPIFFKLIMNLIAKAVTSPFALLASVLDGDDETLGTVAFAPGSSRLQAQARAQLDKVAQAMQERPALTMTVAGAANLATEREGYKRERLEALMLAEKRRAAVLAGKPVDDTLTLEAAEREDMLKSVYRRAQIAKPRNLLGLAKALPAQEMEALLLDSIPVDEAHMRELALARGVAVRDYLSSRALPLERLFLGAARVEPPEEAPWVPHAELSLTLK